MRAAVYARRSDEQNVSDELKSTAHQIARARAFAEARGWTVERVFEDDAISGAVEDRPGVVELRAALAQKPRPFDVVITADASRLGREQTATVRLLKTIADAGVRVFYYESGREPDLATALGKFVAGVDAFAAEQYRESISNKTRLALRSRAARGEATSGQVYGYDSVREAGGPVRRVVNLEHAAVIRRVFELVVGGYGFLRIQNLLRAERVPAPTSNGWSRSCVREFLYQELYRAGALSTTGRRTSDTTPTGGSESFDCRNPSG
jgi:DNA invertase Pin-like site-specific DNA recombinase